ncbi:hypothetical protein JCM1393_07820 [Clostridium carnis]
MIKLSKSIAILTITSSIILASTSTTFAYGKHNYDMESTNLLGGRHNTYVERTDPYLIVNVDGIDELTREIALRIPYCELGVIPGQTISYKRIIDLIQSQVDSTAGSDIYKVKGFVDNTYLIEGYSQTSIEVINGNDIIFPIVSKDIKQPKYSIVGEVLLEKLPKVEKPKEMINTIDVIYTPEFFLKSSETGIKQLSLFPEIELGKLNAGYKISSKELQKYAQIELDKKFGLGKYIIESRRLAFSRNISQTNINEDYQLLSEFELNENFEYEVKSQYKDIKSDEYRDLIVDKFYVKENDTSKEVIKEEINTNASTNTINASLNNSYDYNDKDLISLLNEFEEFLNSENSNFSIDNNKITDDLNDKEILNLLENINNQFDIYLNQFSLVTPE